jgi:hypothetical protein
MKRIILLIMVFIALNVLGCSSSYETQIIFVPDMKRDDIEDCVSKLIGGNTALFMMDWEDMIKRRHQEGHGLTLMAVIPLINANGAQNIPCRRKRVGGISDASTLLIEFFYYFNA